MDDIQHAPKRVAVAVGPRGNLGVATDKPADLPGEVEYVRADLHRGAVLLTDEEARWLESAARRAAEDTIVPGAAEALRGLATKLAAAGER